MLPAQNKEQLRSEATNPLSKLKKDVDAMGNKLGSLTRKPTKLKTTETVIIKRIHSLIRGILRQSCSTGVKFYVKTGQFLRKIKQQTSLLLKNKQQY